MAQQQEPSLLVLDCDMCLWEPEMYELSREPEEAVYGDLGGRGKGVVGAKASEHEVVRLFPGALKCLQAFADGKFKSTRLAVASSADTPLAVRCAMKSMSMLEVLPGLTIRELLGRGFPQGFSGNIQVGRSGKLSSNKTTHFRELKKETGILFDEMLFYDDCNWGDNCLVVERGCPGVVTQKTPNGMTEKEFRLGLEKFAKAKSK